MGGYVVNFTVYTMAMIGLICFAVFVYKKITDGAFCSKNSKYLSIEETMSLNPRKTLHVVRAGNEKFLIASDVDRTTLISKLEDGKIPMPEVSEVENTVEKPEETKVEIIEKIFDKVKETSGIDINPSEDKVVHLEPINSARKQVTPRHGTRVQRRRNLSPELSYEVENTNTKGLSPIKEMAKRINEL